MALVGIIALLWSRWPIPLAWLKALELGMIGLLASRVAFVQYRLMLVYSLRDDPMMAQLTMKNVVLLTAILILTYGLYVPKSWRRAALVVGPLALLPFATLLVLYLQHPEAMGWLGQGWRRSRRPHGSFCSVFDAMILLMLAVGSTFGARTMSRLRREVAEARQLGQYRLRRRIGAGGMGEVYLAEHQLLKRPCAVKLIRPGDAADPRALERFEREVRLTATLSHPNTVEIYDYGRAEDGTYYYVMEYLPGLSLAELVERHGPLPPARAVYLLRQVCGALREAHAAGLIHRDIKPSNIFAARRGGMDDVAKLLDFGLVRPAATARAAHLSARGPDPRHAAVHVAGAGDGRPGAGRAERHLLAGGGGLLPADRPAAVRRGGRDRGDDRARPRPGGAAVAGPPRHPRGPGARRVAVPGQGRGRAVPGCREPGASPGRVRLRGGLGPGSCRPVVARLRPGPDAGHDGHWKIATSSPDRAWSFSRRGRNGQIAPSKPRRRIRRRPDPRIRARSCDWERPPKAVAMRELRSTSRRALHPAPRRKLELSSINRHLRKQCRGRARPATAARRRGHLGQSQAALGGGVIEAVEGAVARVVRLPTWSPDLTLIEETVLRIGRECQSSCFLSAGIRLYRGVAEQSRL